MKAPWGSTTMTLAEGAAKAINKILLELCIKATKEVGGAVRHYFDIGVFGYGVCAAGTREGVESALGGVLANEALVPLPMLAGNPLALQTETSVDSMAVSARVPVWVEPVHGYRTPMCEAMAVSGAHIYNWVSAHPNSFPPIVINITDGLVTDSPHQGAPLEEWAQRITSIETNDGPALLFNIFLSASSESGVLFPASPAALPAPGPQLFNISSVMPPGLIRNARASNIPVEPGARALGFNADLAMLVKFLEIGTRVAEVKDR
jgi:hypothetical protein